MLFQKRFWEGIGDGSISLTFRRWERPRVVAGRSYRTGAGRIEVRSIEEVALADISDADARRSGHQSAAELREHLLGVDGNPIYRIEFEFIDAPDPREELAADDALSDDHVNEITARLDRLDRASRHGDWTLAVLELIEEHPATRAPELAASMGRATQPFKTDVRKLKNLGLTYSLNPGYRLSPRGVAYLESVRAGG